MIKVEIEDLLIQVLQEKRIDSHPCLHYLTRRLCYICLAHDSAVGDEKKINLVNEKYLACCEIYKEFKKAKTL